MSQSKHRPGPWIAYNVGGNSGKIYKNWRVGTKDKAICQMFDEEAEMANAKLIAAAPEMLELLQKVFDEMIKFRNTEDWDLSFTVLEELIEKATE